jgi:hypothetical protein
MNMMDGAADRAGNPGKSAGQDDLPARIFPDDGNIDPPARIMQEKKVRNSGFWRGIKNQLLKNPSGLLT